MWGGWGGGGGGGDWCRGVLQWLLSFRIILVLLCPYKALSAIGTLISSFELGPAHQTVEIDC